MTDSDSFSAMLAAVQSFHDKHNFKNTGGEELAYRVALMTEELGGRYPPAPPRARMSISYLKNVPISLFS